MFDVRRGDSNSLSGCRGSCWREFGSDTANNLKKNGVFTKEHFYVSPPLPPLKQFKILNERPQVENVNSRHCSSLSFVNLPENGYQEYTTVSFFRFWRLGAKSVVRSN